MEAAVRGVQVFTMEKLARLEMEKKITMIRSPFASHQVVLASRLSSVYIHSAAFTCSVVAVVTPKRQQYDHG